MEKAIRFFYGINKIIIIIIIVFFKFEKKNSMKRIVLVIGIFIIILNSGFSQDYVKVLKVNTIRAGFEFTPEWQYITSDLYLFNSNKFSDILNQVITGKKKGLFKRRGLELKNILITMKLEGLKGYENITFPLYNFVIGKDEEGNLKINTETNEVIRVIDNYPAPSVRDFIAAKVDVQVITKSDEVKVYKLAASQLETISNVVTNPSTAVIKIVGEFGKLIQAAAEEKEYHFTSTIRIYENDNFNKRLHSIVVFVFVPSDQKEDKIKVDWSDIDSSITSEVVKIDRKFLQKRIKVKKYPYVVIVNYKSKYIPEVPEEIDFDVLKARESKLTLDLSKGIINKEIYELEKELLEYLKLYAQFQMDLNNYLLNLENKTTEDFSKFYFYLVRDYWRIKNYYKIISLARKDNKIYIEEFKPLYEKFMLRVNMHLDQNSNLQKIRNLVETLYYLEDKKKSDISMDSSTIERYLANLYSIPLPNSEQSSPVMQILSKWINYLEDYQYKGIYSKLLLSLKQLELSDESYKKILQIQNDYSLTQCQRCKDSLRFIVSDFQRRYKKYQLEKTKQQFEDVKEKAKIDLIAITKKVSCIKQKLETYPGEKPEYLQLLEEDVIILNAQRQALLTKLNANYLFTNINEIKAVIEDINNNLQVLNRKIKTICNQEPQVCNCNEPWQGIIEEDTLEVERDTLKAKAELEEENM